ncbi:hypothetical protein LIPSTDRAFT_181564 [Lipomyces starkeyi NRRL Y-11557]|uniref:Uncharacterized protein n=1 Tax=Lipomyces starkeyi NRRL Y-11557 TaxID=675824 RepID=A0A1E3PWF1_LIPST|nr:hypothetical protein LIPSTDRAFT_181564 [Lipomyces starkeyi NRRL Y-11557]
MMSCCSCAKCQNFISCLVCSGTNAVSGCLMSVVDNNPGLLIAGLLSRRAADWCAGCRVTCQRSLTLPLLIFVSNSSQKKLPSNC